jgi:hypothetical protein
LIAPIKTHLTAKLATNYFFQNAFHVRLSEKGR